ncbi:hypothetical protein GCM10007332_12910 [Epilithonimonas arachidiradicis]|uniref:Uncharacterized protein n=1 Tax=Epilithonimonas arachidiradicis TaxID=1617282 RepID=A0ABQ1WZM3_9FLAO|nr:hypothetical protein GCM10007332_12910 [Epilithonimonas arachidiradicis]
MFFDAVGSEIVLDYSEILRELTQFYNEIISYKHKDTVIILTFETILNLHFTKR